MRQKRWPIATRISAIAALITVAVLRSASAQAVFSERDKSILRLGVQGSTIYTQFAEGVTQSCNELYASEPDQVKLLYAQLLAAKLTNRKLSRVDYLVTNGVCVLTLVQIDE